MWVLHKWQLELLFDFYLYFPFCSSFFISCHNLSLCTHCTNFLEFQMGQSKLWEKLVKIVIGVSENANLSWIQRLKIYKVFQIIVTAPLNWYWTFVSGVNLIKVDCHNVWTTWSLCSSLYVYVSNMPIRHDIYLWTHLLCRRMYPRMLS